LSSDAITAPIANERNGLVVMVVTKAHGPAEPESESPPAASWFAAAATDEAPAVLKFFFLSEPGSRTCQRKIFANASQTNSFEKVIFFS
jgi:hypothetical protein